MSCTKSESDLNPQTSLVFSGTASEQNIYLTYICLIGDIGPHLSASSSLKKNLPDNLQRDGDETEDDSKPFKIVRTRAKHKLVEASKKRKRNRKTKGEEEESFKKQKEKPSTSSNGKSDDITATASDPEVLELTEMKCLGEDQTDSQNSSCHSISSFVSTSSFDEDSDDDCHPRLNEKVLSTVLRLDREHNIFGLSNIAIVESKPSRKCRKEDGKPVFHQTAIVQMLYEYDTCTSCCGTTCSRTKSKTSLPCSLSNKNPNCLFCYKPRPHQCFDPYPSPPLRSRTRCTPIIPKGCKVRRCVRKCSTVCGESCDKPTCCKPKNCTCNGSSTCPPARAVTDTSCYGMSIRVKRKPKYEPSPIEVTPRSSCIMSLPLMARPSCQHVPRCVPPERCGVLMPCYWPARRSAPCPTPNFCFHNPACTRPRTKPPCTGNVLEKCDKNDPCGKNKPCMNTSCLGRSEEFKEALKNAFRKA